MISPAPYTPGREVSVAARGVEVTDTPSVTMKGARLTRWPDCADRAPWPSIGVDGCVTLLVDGAAVQLQRIGGDGNAVIVLVVRRHRVGEHQLGGRAIARRVGGVAGVRADGQRQARRAARGVHRDRLVEGRRDLDDVAGHVAAVGVRGRGDRRTSHSGALRAVDADFLQPGKRIPTAGAPPRPNLVPRSPPDDGDERRVHAGRGPKLVQELAPRSIIVSM